MGQSRDDSLPPGVEPSGWMLAPLLIHTAGTALLGLLPVLGWAMVAAPTRLFLQAADSADAAQVQAAMTHVQTVLQRVGLISVSVTAVIAVLWLIDRNLRQRPPASGPTWGCGYTAGSARLQYTAGSFSKDFAHNYDGALVLLKRQKAPSGYFPDDAYVVTDCVDAVERRLYNVIGQGNQSAGLISRLMHEDDPRLGFALGLAAVVAIAALVLLSQGALP